MRQILYSEFVFFVRSSPHSFVHPSQSPVLLLCMKTVAKLIIGVRVIVIVCKLINTVVSAK